jgi:glycerol-3-phosphate dehydrogenase (NAD(P)+)
MRLTSDIQQAMEQADVVIIATPSRAFITVLEQIQPYFHQQKLVIATKGLIPAEDFLFSSQVEKVLKADFYAFLYGPSHAEEVVQRMPAWVTIASSDIAYAQMLG